MGLYSGGNGQSLAFKIMQMSSPQNAAMFSFGLSAFMNDLRQSCRAGALGIPQIVLNDAQETRPELSLSTNNIHQTLQLTGVLGPPQGSPQ